MSTQAAAPLFAGGVNNVEAGNGPPLPTIVSLPFSWPARTSIRSAFEFSRTPLHQTPISAFHQWALQVLRARHVIVELPMEISPSLTSRCAPTIIDLFLSDTASGSRSGSRLSFSAQHHFYGALSGSPSQPHD
ncbi:hypothetical protein BDZ89DRAFT_1060960 [Hymenopellis radicata]|nr:hypothetical protein BDZ89DRAFT_1060960 [Hymenopellis radicata]